MHKNNRKEGQKPLEGNNNFSTFHTKFSYNAEEVTCFLDQKEKKMHQMIEIRYSFPFSAYLSDS